MKDYKKKRALWILLALVFALILFLLGTHAMIVGKGSLIYDLMSSAFLSIATVALLSGVLFPLFALILIPFFPIIVIYFFLKNRKQSPRKDK